MVARPPDSDLARRRLRVSGVVQGVGFRPFVYGLALELGLAGLVGNDSAGVFIELEGPSAALDLFAARLIADAPPLAVIETVQSDDMPITGSLGFNIVESARREAANTLISPDMCVCADCIRDFQDPANRRYRYPFINCTNCGPRFTIIDDIPYDRPLTTMAGFPTVPRLRGRVRGPHRPALSRPAQRLPGLWPADLAGDAEGALHGCFKDMRRHSGPARGAARGCSAGQIVAIKGLGGFHLACDATNAKRRRNSCASARGACGKPFAVMARALRRSARLLPR